METRLQKQYKDVIVPALIEKFGYKNKMQVPKLEKIVLNMGIEGAVKDMEAIAGQKPVITHSRKSIATFKLRSGMPIGCKVTLRREKMYEFLDRLITIAMPRIRDFRGISGKSFDGHGNYAMGIKEQIIFLEINYDAVDAIRGMDIVITTSAKTDEEAKALLAGFGMPFMKEGK